MLHFADGLFLDVLRQPFIAPVLTHRGMQKVLMNGRQFFTESRIEFFYDLQ